MHRIQTTDPFRRHVAQTFPDGGLESASLQGSDSRARFPLEEICPCSGLNDSLP